ncbi:peptidoglycan-binding domain-containing protein [Streptomyces sp. NPDC002773]|uniref:peptidoglycan-binding domain-containing protein n=1 Tax=Streptomyces sp. NPDC002773 TaxID=3154430 RepID=UPI00332E54C0
MRLATARRRTVGIAIASLIALTGTVTATGEAEAAAYPCSVYHDDTGRHYSGYYTGSTVQPSSTQVTAAGKEAQCLLKYFGHDPGTVDGIFGSKSRAAAKRAQEIANSKCRAGLVVDGLIGPKSWPYLRFEACSRA